MVSSEFQGMWREVGFLFHNESTEKKKPKNTSNNSKTGRYSQLQRSGAKPSKRQSVQVPSKPLNLPVCHNSNERSVLDLGAADCYNHKKRGREKKKKTN